MALIIVSLHMRKRAQIGVIGCGDVANSHLPNILACDRLHLRADPDASRLKEYSQIAECDYSTSDAGEIIKDPDVDGIMILTSNDMHAPLAVETLAAGKHVFVEKPLALSRDDCRKIIEVAERVDRGVMVGFWYHLHRGFLEIRRRIPHPYMTTAQCAVGASGAMIDYRPRFLNRYLRNH